MKKTKVIAASAGAAALALAMGSANAVTYDGTTAGDTNVINNATFYTNDANGSVGTGVFPRFVAVGGNDPSNEGYNTFAAGGGLDIKNSPLRMPTVANLQAVSNPNGLTGSFYEFFLDVNEAGNNIDKYLSLDDVEICVRTTNNALSEAGGAYTSGCGGGSLIYRMDGNADNTLLMDYSINKGSGNGVDILLYIPTAWFTTALAGGDPNNYFIYLYSKFGGFGDQSGYTGTDYPAGDYRQMDGYEEWAYRACPEGSTTCTPPPCSPTDPTCYQVPEPGSLAILGLSLLGLGLARRRPTVV